MRIFANLFTRSPFLPLQAHMEEVTKCVHKMDELYEAYIAGDSEKMIILAEEVYSLEHDADITKNEIRNNLPKGMFLAINRASLLEILALQDTIADKAEDIAVLMTLKKLKPIKSLGKDLKNFVQKNIEAVDGTHAIIRQMNELLETSFGGKEAEKVRGMVEGVALLEHEADILQRNLLKKLFKKEEELSYGTFFLWINILQSISSLSDLSEKLANRIRMLLDVK